MKLGLAGNLRDFEFTGSDGALKRGDELDYNGSPAGYADQPDEVINYVDAHDNETLYDLSVFKLPTDTSMADRVRMNTLSLATVDAVAVALVLARRHRAAALEVARPQQLQLGRLVQPHRLDGPGVDVRLGPADRGRQRRTSGRSWRRCSRTRR